MIFIKKTPIGPYYFRTEPSGIDDPTAVNYLQYFD